MIKKFIKWLKNLFKRRGDDKKNMAYGLEVRDSAGGVVLDQLTTCGHIYKSITVPAGIGNWTYRDAAITADMVAVLQMMWDVAKFNLDHPVPIFTEVSAGQLLVVRNQNMPSVVVHILRVK